MLVVGWKNLGALEWTGVAGGPVLIYGIRTATTAFFNYRIEALSSKLKEQQEERAKTIQKLKDATKYDSTLQLLEKYGGPDNKPKSSKKKGDGDEETVGEKQQGHDQQSRTPNRTAVPPPATANIPRRDVSRHLPPAQGPNAHPSSPAPPAEVSAEFAPNAFGPHGPPPPNPYPPMRLTRSEANWYDRILDTLLGEDETAAKNRIILICGQCRQVNGQAPPGTKSLSEVGTWKCMSCNATNGELDEGQRIVREVLGERASMEESLTGDDGVEDSSILVKTEKEEASEEGEPVEPSTRKRKGKKKN